MDKTVHSTTKTDIQSAKVENSTIKLLKDHNDEKAVDDFEKDMKKNSKKDDKSNKTNDLQKTPEDNKKESDKIDLDKELDKNIEENNTHKSNNKSDNNEDSDNDTEEMNGVKELNNNVKSITNISDIKNNTDGKDVKNQTETNNEIKDDDHSKSKEKIDYNKEILDILTKHDDLYAKEYLLKELHMNTYIDVKENTLDELYSYIKTYTEATHFVDTHFNEFMIEFIKNIKISNNTTKILACVALLDTNEIYVEYFRKILGYSKIYSNLKEAIASMFEKNKFLCTKYTYQYIAYLITLLNNDQLVYKNLKPLLSTLIKYIKNDVVERNIESCAILTSAVVQGAPTLFTDKLVASILAYFNQILLNPRYYISFNLDEVIKCVILILKTYKNIDKSLIAGMLRENITKMTEYRNTSIFEEIKMITNCCDILTEVFKKYSEKQSIDDYVKKHKEYLEPKFISVKPSKEKNNDIRDSVDLINNFLSYKYRYMDLLLKHHNCYVRIDLINELANCEEPGLIFQHFNNFNEYVDWNDLMDIKVTVGTIKYLFNDYFLDNRKEVHRGIIRVFYNNLDKDQFVYFAKFASLKNCYFVIIDVYMTHINDNNYEHMRTRQMINKSVNDITLTEEVSGLLDEFSKIEKCKLTEDGYRNLLLLLIVVVSKLKPKEYKSDSEDLTSNHINNIKKFKSFVTKYITPDNTFNDYYVGLLFYLEKDVNRPFYNYFDVLQELMGIQYRKLGKDEMPGFKDRTFPLIFQMTDTEVTELGILYKNYEESRYIEKYKEILSLIDEDDKQKDSENKEGEGVKSDTEDIEDWDTKTSSESDLSGISTETLIDHEKEFLKEQRKIILEKYDLAQREKLLEAEKYRLAEKEHELVKKASEKYSKEQRKLIKKKYKEAKAAWEAMNEQFERIRKQKEEMENNMKKGKKEKTINILEDNLRKAKEDRKNAKEDFNKAKQKYKQGEQRYKDALNDLEILKEGFQIKPTEQPKNNEISKLSKGDVSDELKDKDLINKTENEKMLDEFRKGGNKNDKPSKVEVEASKSTEKRNKSNDKNDVNMEEDYKADYSQLFKSPSIPKKQ